LNCKITTFLFIDRFSIIFWKDQIMHQKYSTTFFSQINELVAQPTNKTKFYLTVVTLLVGVVASSHAAIAGIDQQPQLIAGNTDYPIDCGKSGKKCGGPYAPLKSQPMPEPRMGVGVHSLPIRDPLAQPAPPVMPDYPLKKSDVPNGVTNKVITAPNPVTNNLPAPNVIKDPSSR
jgi:hypothetical protein